jgi:hypothetical protein
VRRALAHGRAARTRATCGGHHSDLRSEGCGTPGTCLPNGAVDRAGAAHPRLRRRDGGPFPAPRGAHRRGLPGRHDRGERSIPWTSGGRPFGWSTRPIEADRGIG